MDLLSSTQGREVSVFQSAIEDSCFTERQKIEDTLPALGEIVDHDITGVQIINLYDQAAIKAKLKIDDVIVSVDEAPIRNISYYDDVVIRYKMKVKVVIQLQQEVSLTSPSQITPSQKQLGESSHWYAAPNPSQENFAIHQLTPTWIIPNFGKR